MRTFDEGLLSHALETIFVLLAGAPIDPKRLSLVPSPRLQVILKVGYGFMSSRPDFCNSHRFLIISQEMPLHVSLSVTSYVSSASNILEEHRLGFVGDHLLGWKQTSHNVVFVLAFLEGLACAQKFALLRLLALQFCGRLLERSLQPDGGESYAANVAKRMLLGWQHSAQLLNEFEKPVEQCCTRELQSKSNETVNHPDLTKSIVPFSWSIWCLVAHLDSLESGNNAVVVSSSLKDLLQSRFERKPPYDEIRALLSPHAWMSKLPPMVAQNRRAPWAVVVSRPCDD